MNSGVLVPQRIARLPELADNLWWSWHPAARDLFKALSEPLWRSTEHNPVRILKLVSFDRLERLSRDPHFLEHYDRVLAELDSDLANGHLWFSAHYPDLRRPVAYFSAEFGLHGTLPIYSGGLGVLSGDHCKEASDLGLPFVGVGFLYPQGYFRQSITPDGLQETFYDQLDYEQVPIYPVLQPGGDRLLVQVTLRGTPVFIQVWQVRAGRVSLYLMDTNVEQNAAWDRDLSARLYGGDQETRVRQEMVLGLGGVRVLRALGIQPAAWHLNEGHSAFLVLERLRELVQAGTPFDPAVKQVRRATLFTTHTPVPAGHDAFPFSLIDEYFGHFWQEIGMDRQQFMALGEHDGRFNMTVLALRMAGASNGVSQLHGQVSRSMWQGVWPGRPVDQVPIGAITNGVHAPSWISTQLKEVFAQYLAPDWEVIQDSPSLWDGIDQIPDTALWQVHQELKAKLLAFINERTRELWRRGELQSSQVLASGVLLDPGALTIGFCRRFATYKRATLLFRDAQRLKSLLFAERRPVQIIFAGKAHPADGGGKELIQQVYRYAKDPEFGGRIAFLEDYDLHSARFLVQGVDVWLNNPRRPNEASGTSGMKAAMNGVPNLSVLDGWWLEGYQPAEGDRPANGWAFGDGQSADPEVQDEADSQALYRLLEEQVVPLYYDRDAADVPRGWAKVMKQAIRTSVAAFGTRRMVREYVEKMYLPALRG
jgi:starch phosphorylase